MTTKKKLIKMTIPKFFKELARGRDYFRLTGNDNIRTVDGLCPIAYVVRRQTGDPYFSNAAAFHVCAASGEVFHQEHSHRYWDCSDGLRDAILSIINAADNRLVGPEARRFRKKLLKTLGL